MHWDVYDHDWNPIAVLEDPKELYPMVEEWEKQFNNKVVWSKLPNTFAIGEQQFKVTYAYRYYTLTTKK